MIACHLRYVVNAAKLREFELYSRVWITLVNRFGGRHQGYLMPSEGASNVALATFTFPSLAAYEQYRVLPFYDSMVAKLIVQADSRPAAIMRMRRALREYIVEGISTNIAFHKRILESEPFVQGRYDTRLVERLLAEGAAGRAAS